MPTSTHQSLLRTPFLKAVRKSGLLTPDDLVAVLAENPVGPAADPIQVAALLVRKKLLTKFQAMQLLGGRTQGFVLGQYKILDGIRQDRVGMVFKAENSDTREAVAVKVLPTDRASDPMVMKEFMKEVRAAAKVDHPNVARVLDIGYHNGTHFVVAEHVGGPTLDKVVAEKGPLAPHVAARLVAQTAVGLHYAHARDLLHRDVKPGNIAVLPDRRAKLIDLGLTHMLENPWKSVTRRISTREYAEEIAHIAPEQAWGCDLDPRSDVYSLGSTFYYLLTGRVPFPGTAPAAMTERQVRGIPAPSEVRPGVPREIDALVKRMGAKDPHERFPSAREVAAAMHAWLPSEQWAELGISPTGPAPDRPPAKAPARKRGFFARLFGR